MALSVQATIDRDRRGGLRLSGEIGIVPGDGRIEVGPFCLDRITVDQWLIGLGAVTFLDAAGLGALVGLRNDCRVADTTVERGSVPGLVTSVRIIGVDVAFLPGCGPPSASTAEALGDRSTSVPLTGVAATAPTSIAAHTGWSEPTGAADPGDGFATASSPPTLTGAVPTLVDPDGRDGLGAAS